MDWLTDPQAWLALVTLTALEIVLGIDNIIFISILTGQLPQEQQGKAQQMGLGLAMLSRLALLVSLSWVMGLTKPLMTVLEYHISGRDIILIVGGLFLLAKSTMEIHKKLEGDEEHAGHAGKTVSFSSVLVQIMLLDIIFSLDSVITAVGMARDIEVMIVAVVISVGIMLFFAQAVSRFIERHPTVKVLALSFLLMIGIALIADGLSFHIPKGYIYFAMAFSVGVELINIKARAQEVK
ncbi:MAG: TerC family protein [Trichlorobacter sp.]